MAAAAHAAPNPLSILTTVSPAAQELSIARSGTMPERWEPYPTPLGHLSRGMRHTLLSLMEERPPFRDSYYNRCLTELSLCANSCGSCHSQYRNILAGVSEISRVCWLRIPENLRFLLSRLSQCRVPALWVYELISSRNSGLLGRLYSEISLNGLQDLFRALVPNTVDSCSICAFTILTLFRCLILTKDNFRITLRSAL